jgi:hypothetical protein
VEFNGLDGRNIHCFFTARKENEVRSSVVLVQKDKMAHTVGGSRVDIETTSSFLRFIVSYVLLI